MVLESLINTIRAKKHPGELFLLGFLYASAGLFLGRWIFQEHSSLIMVFLTVMAALPLLYTALKQEEVEDTRFRQERIMLKEHGKIMLFFLFLFLGFVAAYTFWYIVLPTSWVQTSFKIQTTTIQAINTRISGNYVAARTLTYILLNNMKVLVFCILFSFLYGAGAIFILTWNASVISSAIGNFIRTNIAFYTSNMGFAKYASYFQIVSLGLLRYLLHGIPEIIAYFIAAIAGGIISAAVIREKFGTRNFEKIVLDSANLILISIAILVFAAFLEVFITPLLF